MRKTVFYAWQSDLPNKCNRGFIRDALERALKEINAMLSVEDALRPDQDTENVPGNPSVTDAIYNKIDSCRIFVPDISIVTAVGASRPMPNPNVMIEYGRATKSVGDQFIIPVFNSAFGDWITDRPFDMRHKRQPITYHLPERHSVDEKQTARKRLVDQFVKAVAAVLEHGSPEPVEFPSDEKFHHFRQRYLAVRAEGGSKSFGFWCGLIPVSREISIQRPFEHKELFERAPYIQGRFSNSPLPLELGTIDDLAADKTSVTDITPTKEAAERKWSRHVLDQGSRSVQGEDVCVFRVERNGGIFLAVKTNYLQEGAKLYLKWIIADVANALRTADRIRNIAGTSEMPYALMVELRFDDNSIPVESENWRVGLLRDEWPRTTKEMKSEPLNFGPFRVGNKSQFSQLLTNLLADMYMAVGARPIDEFEIIFE